MMLDDVCDDGVSSGALRWELVKLLELAASQPHLSGCSPSSTVVIIIMVSQDHHHGESGSSSSFMMNIKSPYRR